MVSRWTRGKWLDWARTLELRYRKVRQISHGFTNCSTFGFQVSTFPYSKAWQWRPITELLREWSGIPVFRKGKTTGKPCPWNLRNYADSMVRHAHDCSRQETMILIDLHMVFFGISLVIWSTLWVPKVAGRRVKTGRDGTVFFGTFFVLRRQPLFMREIDSTWWNSWNQGTTAYFSSR